MKKYLLITFAAGSFLVAGASLATAEPMKMSHTEMVEMCKTMGAEDCRMMMREMVKNKAMHKVMIEELSKDPAFNDAYRQQLKDGAHGGG